MLYIIYIQGTTLEDYDKRLQHYDMIQTTTSCEEIFSEINTYLELQNHKKVLIIIENIQGLMDYDQNIIISKILQMLQQLYNNSTTNQIMIAICCDNTIVEDMYYNSCKPLQTPSIEMYTQTFINNEKTTKDIGIPNNTPYIGYTLANILISALPVDIYLSIAPLISGYSRKVHARLLRLQQQTKLFFKPILSTFHIAFGPNLKILRESIS